MKAIRLVVIVVFAAICAEAQRGDDKKAEDEYSFNDYDPVEREYPQNFDDDDEIEAESVENAVDQAMNSPGTSKSPGWFFRRRRAGRRRRRPSRRRRTKGKARKWKPNGCTTPGGMPFFYKKRFTPACIKHDICYYYKQKPRKACDKDFLIRMRKTCRGLGWFKTRSCKFWAGFYYTATRVGGKSYYGPNGR